MNLSEIKKVASTLQKALFNRGRSYSLGMWKSHFKGNGLQFKEHQVYGYGDEVRFIDWKITARTSQPYIKTFEEERNLNITIVVDATSSMYEGHYEKSKVQSAVEIAALIIVLAGKTRDKVNIILIHEEIYSIRGLSGDVGLVRFITLLQKIKMMNGEGQIERLKVLKKQPKASEVENFVTKHDFKTREIVVLTDFENYFSNESFYRNFLKTHFHLFNMTCKNQTSFDQRFEFEAYSIGKGKVSLQEFKNSNKININKKIQNIDISGNHLEFFIGAMS